MLAPKKYSSSSADASGKTIEPTTLLPVNFSFATNNTY